MENPVSASFVFFISLLHEKWVTLELEKWDEGKEQPDKGQIDINSQGNSTIF
jgi:hypothetical protein